MGVVQTLIGNVKGPQGEQGAQGVQGEQGDAATISVGSVTTVPYGTNASVVNSGTEQEAILDFRIPQGRPGEQVTQVDNLVLNSITEPSTQFPVPAIGDVGSTLFGKISKWCSDMAALVASKFDAANVVNNLTTTSSGYALDARQGKALNDVLSGIGNTTANGLTASNGTLIHAAKVKIGKFVIYTIRFDPTAQTAANMPFISGAEVPYAGIYGAASTLDNNGNRIYVDSNGRFCCTAVLSTGSTRFSIAYICA